MTLTHVDLFSGIGGFALAARWNGIKTVQFVELDPFCCKVLAKNFPGVPIHGDIKTFHGPIADSGIGGDGSFAGNIPVSEERGRNTGGEEVPCAAPSGGLHRGIESDGKTFTNAKHKGLERLNKQCDTAMLRSDERISVGRRINARGEKPFILTGGFPCQPFSCAGKRKGTSDDRHLWPEMLRVIQELRPRWVVAENVSGLVNIKNVVEQSGDADMEDEAIDGGEGGVSTSTLVSILTDLEESGYSVQVFIIPACAVGAPHRRDRVWIVAHSDGKRERTGHREVPQAHGEIPQRDNDAKSEQPDSHAPDSCNEGLQRGEETRDIGEDGQEPGNQFIGGLPGWSENWPEVAQRFCKLDDGVPADMDGRRLTRNKYRTQKLKALGNAIVPQVAAELMRAILEAEGGK